MAEDVVKNVVAEVKNSSFVRECFIDWLVNEQVLQFGDFTLKSGRKSPFFLKLDTLNSGEQLAKLAEAYADTIYEESCGGKIPEFDVIFGPAYKGIPLASIVAMYLWLKYDMNVKYCANRKEVKDHGDGGDLIGCKLKTGDQVLIIEDVTTSGKSIEEVMPTIDKYGAKAVAEIISVDRCEKAGDSDEFALKAIERKYGFPVIAIVTMEEVVRCLYTDRAEIARTVITEEIYQKLQEYYTEYGGKDIAEEKATTASN